MARIEAQTTKPYYPCGNKAESIIKIINGKAKRTSFQRNIPKRVWYFSTVREVDIYYCTEVKNGRPDLEKLTGDTIDISEYMEFEFYYLVWLWNNQSDDTNIMLGR